MTMMDSYNSVRIVMVMLVLMIISLPIMTQSNEGRDFWLGFMEHIDEGNNDMVVMISSRVSTIGSISIPGRQWSESFAVSANDITVLELPSFAETIGSEFINDNAIRITSRDDISVYMHQYFGNRSEASIVLPTTSLGSTYYVMSYAGAPNTFGVGVTPSEFLIVATEDETTITFDPAAQTQFGIVSGNLISVTLNAGEVYQVRARIPEADLTGTFVSGDKDFALFAGTSWSQVPVGCRFMDNLLEQMYPISTWGTKYVGSPFARTSFDIYRVMAYQNGTRVDIQGDLSATTQIDLNAGEYYEFQTSEGVFLESTEPILVAQYITGSECNGRIGDPSMVVLNSVEQIRDTVTLFNSRFFDISLQFINITIRTGEEDLVFLDGQQMTSIGASFMPVGDDGEFSYTSFLVSSGAHTIYTSGCGIIAIAYGYGTAESYAYGGGASFVKINENPIPPGGCLNDTIVFDTGLPEDRFRVFWDLGNGFTTSEHKFEYQYTNLGSYPISLVIEDLCFEKIDTSNRDLMITLRQDITAIDEAAGCEGSDIRLEAFDLRGATYEWIGPEEFETNEQFPLLEGVSLDQQGVYQVVGNISGCKTFPIDVFVEIFENPKPSLGNDAALCPLDGERLVLDAGEFAAYEWHDRSDGREYIGDQIGSISVLVTDEFGCQGADTLLLIQQCPTRLYVPTIFSPNGDGVSDTFGVSGIEIIAMTMHVYNSWGELVFKSENEEDWWDGTFRGAEASIGQYTWTLSYQGYLDDASEFSDHQSGSILLVR